MIEFADFSILSDTEMNAFVVANITSTAICFMLLMYAFLNMRHLFLRPSLILAGFFHLFLQWPLAFYSGFYSQWLPQPWHLTFAVHGCVLLPLLAAFILPDHGIREQWDRMTKNREDLVDEFTINIGLGITSLLAIITLGHYFTFVPIKCTGLAAYFAAPEAVFILRDFSLKMLTNSSAAYAYSFYANFISIFLFLFLLMKIKCCFEARRYAQMAGFIGACVVTLALGCLEASIFRYISYAFIFILFLLWNNQLWFSLSHIALFTGIGTGLVLLTLVMFKTNMNAEDTPGKRDQIYSYIDTCISRIALDPLAKDRVWQDTQLGYIKRNKDNRLQQREPTMTNQLPALAQRVFVIPLVVGSWYFHHAQTHELFGIQGISRLAKITGQERISVGNLIGLIYGPRHYGYQVAKNVNASTGFLFIQYASFGMLGIIISFTLVFLLDALLLLILKLSESILPVYMAFISLACFNLIQSDYTYILFSGGLLPATAMMLLLHLTIKGLGRYRKGKSRAFHV